MCVCVCGEGGGCACVCVFYVDVSGCVSYDSAVRWGLCG